MVNTVQTKKKSPLFPDVPRGPKAINESGQFTEVWHLGFSSLFQALQKNFSNEGIQIPQLSTADLNTILEPYTRAAQQQKTLQEARLPNISGKKVFDYTAEAEKTFIINFVTPGNESTAVSAAAWKTVTLV